MYVYMCQSLYSHAHLHSQFCVNSFTKYAMFIKPEYIHEYVCTYACLNKELFDFCEFDCIFVILRRFEFSNTFTYSHIRMIVHMYAYAYIKMQLVNSLVGWLLDFV